MKLIQKLLPSYLGIFNKLGHMTTRLFRATFLDMFSQHTIVVEFEAPFPVDTENVDYGKLATQRLGEMIRKGEVAIRDIEPVEQQ